MNLLHRKICSDIAAHGGRALLVGGCVRDLLLRLEPQDIDCEVHDLAPDALSALLSEYGEVDRSGEPFGVYTLKKEEFDFALPRIERRTGSAHTDFEITPIPSLSPREAAARRDFTVNAIMMDALTGEIIDPYGGAEDLKAGVLRAVPGGQFEEDPLRVLRGAQFCARFALHPDKDTLARMRRMPLLNLSAQRVMGETRKALLHAGRPGDYFRVLKEAGALTPWFEELSDVLDCAAERLDCAAPLRERTNEPLMLMLAAMTCAPGEEAAKRMLSRLGVSKQDISSCLGLCEGQRRMKNGSVHPHLVFDACAHPAELALFCVSCGEDEARMMERLRLYEAAASRPMPTGSMLLAAGAKPGPDMKRLLAAARKAALMGMDAGEAVHAVMKNASFG